MDDLESVTRNLVLANRILAAEGVVDALLRAVRARG